MNFSKVFSGWVGGLLGAALVVVLALLAWVWLAPPAPVEDVAEPAKIVSAPEVAPDAPGQPEAPAAPEAAGALAPSFDVVRIKPDGSALVAGRAEPGAQVSVLVEGAPVAVARADDTAGFVAMFTLPPMETDRVMTLEAELDDGTRMVSEMNVIVEGVELPDIVVADAETGTEPAPDTAPEPAAAQPAPAEGAAPGTVTPPQAVAPEPTGEAESAALEPAPSAPEAPAMTTVEPAPAPDAAAEAPASETPAPVEPVAAPPAPAPSAPEAVATEAPAAAETSPAATSVAEAPGAAVPAEPTAPAEPAAPAQPEPAAPPLPEAPRILLAGPDGVRVLQDTSPDRQLSIDAIAYDDAGEVALSGRGQGEGTLRIYLDNAPVGIAQIGPEGQWRAPLPDVDAGVYTLRVDSLSPEGEVIGRVETPFKREDAAVLAAAGEKAAAAAAEGRTLSAITVQPGHTLWAIAEGRYGEGIQYWTIFDANRDQIRDPDWIYPGQVFTLPDASE